MQMWYSCFKDTLAQENHPFFKKGEFYILVSPATFRHNCSLQVHAAPFQWRLTISTEKNVAKSVIRSQEEASSSKKLLSENNRFCQLKTHSKYTDKNYRLEDYVCIYSCSSNNRDLVCIIFYVTLIIENIFRVLSL